MRLRRPRFDELVEDWVRELETEGKSGDTLRAYRSDLRLWHESGLDAHSYLLTLRGHGAKPATINRRRSVLRAYHGWLVDRGHLDRNPLDKTRPTKMPRRLQKTLTVDQVASLIDAAAYLGRDKNHSENIVHLGHLPIEAYRARLAAMIALQVTSGLRVSELCKVSVDKVDLERRTVRVIRKGNKEQQLRFGMSAKRAIQAWLPYRPDSEYLFCGVSGNATTPKSYSRQLEEACRWAELEPINPHTLRHTFATLAIESGIPVADVQQMLGHEQIATTMGYVHRHPDRGFDRYAEHPLEGEIAPEVEERLARRAEGDVDMSKWRRRGEEGSAGD